MPIKGQSPKQIVHTEMHKFKHGQLHSGSKHGPLVKSRKQAIAIALSESGQSKYQSGGDVQPIPINPMNQTADPSVIPMGAASGAPRIQSIPRSPEEINPNQRVELGTLFRGVEGTATPQTAIRTMKGGDLGDGIYFSPSREIAGSYGGGPTASLSKGTRKVHSYDVNGLFPEDVAYVFGGSKKGEPVHLISGNGIPLWKGSWSGSNIEKALKDTDIKAVIGAPNSIAHNQISIRDPAILNPKARGGKVSNYAGGGDVQPIPINPMNETSDPSVRSLGSAGGPPSGPQMVLSPRLQEAFLKRNWQQHGRDLDWDAIPNRVWNREAKEWNKKNYTNVPMAHETYHFGSKPDFEKYMDNKYLAGRKEPFPGINEANEYFADSGEPHHTVYVHGHEPEYQSGGNIPIRTPNTLNAMMQGVEQDPLNPHAQLGMLAPYAIPGAPMPSARVKRPVHIDEKSEKEKDKGYAKGGLTFNQRWRDVPIQAEDFGDRFYPGYVGQTHGEESPLYTPLTRRAEEIGQQQAPATFEARWPSKPFGTFPLYQQASPYAVGGPIGNQKAPRQEEDFTDTDRQGGIMAPPATKDPNEMATDELEDKRQFRSGNPPQKYQMGGFNPEKAMSIGLSRRASQASGGLLKSQIPGRTDQIQASIPKGAYIIPADVVSGMGQGNTDAGGAILGKLMNRGPFNMNLPKRTAGSRVGSRHSSLKFSQKFDDGGGVGEPEPVLAAGGEYVVMPHEVAALGAGDVDTGHNILDAFVKHMREKTISTMRKLPGPKGAKK